MFLSGNFWRKSKKFRKSIKKDVFHLLIILLPGVAFADGKLLLCKDLQRLFDDLSVQLGIRGKGDVLFLNCGIHLYIPVMGIISIDTDAFPENKSNTRLTDPMAKMSQFGGLIGYRGLKGLKTAEILVIQILRSLLHDTLVRYIADVLEDQQSDHQPDGFGRTAVVRAIERTESVFTLLPITHWPGYKVDAYGSKYHPE